MFTKSFQQSTDLLAFLQAGSKVLRQPKIKEYKIIKKHVLRFTVEAKEGLYYVQFDAEKRNDYRIGGMIIKKIK